MFLLFRPLYFAFLILFLNITVPKVLNFFLFQDYLFDIYELITLK